jgi:hypothetical protein
MSARLFEVSKGALRRAPLNPRASIGSDSRRSRRLWLDATLRDVSR